MLDWLLGRKPTKERLLNHKRVTILGTRFVIRPINVLADFPQDKVPQIFTDFSRKNYAPNPSNDKEIKRLQDDMKAVVRAGLVSPNDKDGITVDDLSRDLDLLHKLYLAIIDHSLLRFRGLTKCFFLVLKTLIRFTNSLRLTGRHPARWPLETA